MPRLFSRRLTVLVCAVCLLASTDWAIAQNPLHSVGRMLRQAKNAANRKKPPISKHYPGADIAKQVDWLEHEIEKYGSVVPKQPNVWGEARLTRHRQEYERVLQDKLDKFDITLQGVLRRSDQASLALALALNQAASPTAATAGADASSTVTAIFSGDSIERNSDISKIDLSDFEVNKISLEPTIQLDQLSRYINHLSELRRINEGGDTADSPGYALNLVRIPVSVLPGKHTRAGYGAEINITAEPYLSDELLPTTFRNLVINDMVDQLGLPITRMIEDKEQREKLQEFIEQADEINLARFQVQRIGFILTGKIETATRNKLDGELGSIYAQLIRRLNEELGHPRDAETEQYLTRLLSELPLTWCEFKENAIKEELSRLRKERGNAGTMSAPSAPTSAADKIAELETFRQQWPSPLETRDVVAAADFFAAQGLYSKLNERISELMRQLKNLYADLSLTVSPETAMRTGPRGRRCLLPIPPAHVDEVFGTSGNVLGHVALEAFDALSDREQVHLLDVQNYLRVELEAAFDFLQDDGGRMLQEHCTPQLVRAIRSRRRRLEVATPRRKRNDDVEAGYGERKPPYGLEAMNRDEKLSFPLFIANPTNPEKAIEIRNEDSIIGLRNNYLADIVHRYPRVEFSSTASLGWAVIVESALLNARLMEDMHEAAIEKGCPVMVQREDWLDCHMPQPSPTAIEAFKSYVRCRWPIQVFALDPVTQDQNIADIFSRRRELQLAISAAVASGQMRPSIAMRFARRLETDMETIQLNRTAVAFAHGSNTFGWRFYPRFQTPPVPGTLGAFGQSLLGGPSRDKDLLGRQLEPGIRECVAIVIMPSFVPYATFETRSNWFKLTNPSAKELTMHKIMELSNAYRCVVAQTQRIGNSACMCSGACLCGDDSGRMLGTLNMLGTRLPLQCMRVQIPYENTLGGFELFNTGITDLAPELRGFYGARGVKTPGDYNCPNDGVDFAGGQCDDTCQGTTLFLVGDNFSVHDTKVVAGGKCVPFWLMSRQVMRVTIPPTTSTVTRVVGKQKKTGVAVHVASPYGVSNRLFVPVLDEPKPTADDVSKALEALRVDLESRKFSLVSGQKSSLVFQFNNATLGIEGVLFAGDKPKPEKLKFAYGEKLFPLVATEQGSSGHLPNGVAIGVVAKHGGDYLGSIRRLPGSVQVDSRKQFQVAHRDVLKALQIDITSLTRNDVEKPELVKLSAEFYLILQTDNGLPIKVNGALPINLQLRSKPITVASRQEAIPPAPPRVDTSPTSGSIWRTAPRQAPSGRRSLAREGTGRRLR